MSFFIRKGSKPAPKRDTKKSSTKRKHIGQTGAETVKKRNNVPHKLDEEIESDSEIDSDVEDKECNDAANVGKTKHALVNGDDDDEETAQEKKLRLTKQYLEELAKEEARKAGEDDDDGITQDQLVSARLQEDVLESRGKLQRPLAESYSGTWKIVHTFKGHHLPVTCLTVTSDNKFVFSAYKDSAIVKWSLASGRKVHVIFPVKGHGKAKSNSNVTTVQGHTGHVLALAVSTDNKFLVSGGKDRSINVWNPETCEHIHTFTGHRDAVSGLCFRKNSHQLFSSSYDRSVKIWSLDEMMYVETLFGHQDHITSIDSGIRERCITSGARDFTIRIWKVVEESQLVYLAPQSAGCIECVRLINEDHFVSGADDGSVSLWSVMKKKPLYTYRNAHSMPSHSSDPQGECWVSAIAALTNSDLIATGSRDGYIRVWKCGQDYKSMTPAFSIPMPGFINHLSFTSDGEHLVCGVGQEHKLGRWWKVTHAEAMPTVETPKYWSSTLPLSNDSQDDAAKQQELPSKVKVRNMVCVIKLHRCQTNDSTAGTSDSVTKLTNGCKS